MEPGHIRLKIYCAGPMRAGGRYVDRFHEMVRIVEELGHDALSELSTTVKWGDLERPTAGADGRAPRNAQMPPRHERADCGGAEDAYIYTRDIHWLDGADALVSEVSGPSLGVGYEIAYALHERRIPVLCLLNGDVVSFSAMIGGNSSPLLELARYSSRQDMQGVIRRFLRNVKVRPASPP